jgi:fibronectin type 3 domain-containing protein
MHGGPYSAIGTSASTTYSDTGLTAATQYYYVVNATNAGTTGANSTEATATTPAAVPTNLTATATSGTQISLIWSVSPGATGYNVLRGLVHGGPYTQIGTTTAASYNDSGLMPNTAYYYVVQATISTKASGDSAEATATTLAPVPASLVADTVSATQINLTWTGCTAAISYTVERGTAHLGPYLPIATPATPGYTDTNVSAGTTYFYVVNATTPTGTTANSNEASATTFPVAPTNLAAAAVSSTQVDLTWTASPSALGYQVYRGTVTGGPYKLVGSSNTTVYNDTSTSPAATYYYVVTAVDSAGPSTDSNEASATTLIAAPAGLTAKSISTTQINLAWIAYTAATGYNVYRGTVHGGPYVQVGTTLPGTTTYSDTALNGGTTYYYVITVGTAAGTSPFSPEASATTFPPAPTGLMANAVGYSQIDLTWTAAPSATLYELWRSTVEGGPYTYVGAATQTVFDDTTVAGSTTYYYVATALSGGNSSGYSNEASATSLLAPPSGLKATDAGATQINLTWTAYPGAIGYDVLRGATHGGPYVLVATTLLPTYADTTVVGGTTYFYVVEVLTGTGTSPNSNEASALTAPAPPAGLTALGVTSSQINLSWVAPIGATSYEVWRGVATGGPYTHRCVPYRQLQRYCRGFRHDVLLRCHSGRCEWTKSV